VIVQRRGIEMLCGRQLFHLLPPLREESRAFLPDERCQFIEVIDVFSMWFGAGIIKARRAFSSAMGRSRGNQFLSVSSFERMGVAAAYLILCSHQI
jgi:hypothetical protein